MYCCNSCKNFNICNKKKYNRREIIQLGKRDIWEICSEFDEKYTTTMGIKFQLKANNNS